MKFTLQPLSTSALAISLLFSSSIFGQSFQRTIYDSPNLASDIFTSDINHDGKSDLLTTQSVSNAFTVFLNHGNGTFTSGGSLSFIVAGIVVERMVAADFNGDGNIDVATLACSNGPAVTVLFGNGDGTFTFNHAYFPSITGIGFSCGDSLGLITLPGSKLPSLVVSAEFNQVVVLKNDGHGAFAQQKNIFTPTFTRISGASAGDYNGDHIQDIAAILTDPGGVANNVVIFYGKADGTFRAPVTLFSRNSFLQAANTVDLNGDGRGDLLVPFLQGLDNRAGVIAFTNLGGGNFRTTILTADPFYTFAGRKAAAIHPVGKQPGLRGIVVSLAPDFEAGHPVFAFFPAQGTSWGKPIYFDNPVGTAQAVINGDFNGDGRPDFAAATNSDNLVVFRNTTTSATCAYPSQAGVRICSPDGDNDADDTSRTVKIHTSSSGGVLPIVAMKAYLDGKRVAESDMNTLDASVAAKPGKHTLTVNAWDPNDKVYTNHVRFTVQ
jgi:hypothetical protein